MTESYETTPPIDGWSDELTPIDGLASASSPPRIAKLLRAGRSPSDLAFDRNLPSELRVVSSMFWTPLEVVARAARWLDEEGVRSVIDIGSGAGKFCVAAALASDCHFVGLEHRPRLVKAARELARRFQCGDRVSFREFEFGKDEVPRADAYYLYNPFGENLFGYEDHLDEDVELSEDRYFRDVSAMQALMNAAPIGTCILTYNGFGAPPAATYRELHVDRELRNVLRFWRKVSDG